MIKKLIRNHFIYPFARRMGAWIRESEAEVLEPVECDNNYAWLRWAFLELLRDPLCARKIEYAWGTLQAVAAAKALGYARISALEFGVAGGFGLIALERIGERARELSGVQVDVIGFDSGQGLPKPEDYRDQPNMWFGGQLQADPAVTRSKLRNAKLRVGWVRDTVSGWLAEQPAPIGFVSFDLDLYSSTNDAFGVLRAHTDRMLPRVVCYMDDILGHSYSEFTGVRLLIDEFNHENAKRKLAPIYGLRHYVPRQYVDGTWERLYWAHFFEHPKFNDLDSRVKGVFVDDRGRDTRAVVDSDWQSGMKSRTHAS